MQTNKEGPGWASLLDVKTAVKQVCGALPGGSGGHELLLLHTLTEETFCPAMRQHLDRATHLQDGHHDHEVEAFLDHLITAW